MELWRWSISLWTNTGRTGRIFPDEPKVFDFILDIRKKEKVSKRETLHYNKRGEGLLNVPIGSDIIWTVDAVSKRRSSAESNTFSDWLERISIILPGLISETEESKEDKGAENNDPTLELHINFSLAVTSPYHTWNLLNGWKLEMNVLPADVWLNGEAALKNNAIDSYWYIEQNFNTSKAHESKESVGGNVAAGIAWEYSVELGVVFIEGNDSHDSVGGGKEPNDYRG